MSTENGKMFRSSISGYNKDDVNRYILETDRKNKEKTDALSEELEELKKINAQRSEEVEELKAQKEESAARLAELEAMLDSMREENRTQAESLQEMTKRHDFCKQQNEAQNEALARSRDEIAELNETLRSLTARLEGKDAEIQKNAEKYAADLEALRDAHENEIRQMNDAAKVDDGVAYKLDMYDRISSQIGDILINANRNSDEIITAARNEADQLLKDSTAMASDNSRRMREGIHTCADEALDELKSEFSSNISGCIGELQTCIADIQYETNALMAFLTRKHTEMTERIDFYHNSISDSIDSKLETMETKCSGIINSESEEK